MLGRLTLALAAALLIAAAPARGAVPAGNLLANPGGEAAPGAASDSARVPVPGWTVEGTLTTVAYGTTTFPSVAEATKLGGGRNFFAGGPGGALSAVTQVIDVSSAAAEIDAGGVPATLSALLGGWSSQGDAATVSATFTGAAGTLAVLALPAVTPVDRNSLTTLLPRTGQTTVPAGTRSITVRVEATRLSGNYNDGYADNIALALGAPAPVFHKSVFVEAVSGKVLVKRPGKGFVEFTGTQDIPLGSTIDTRKGVIELSSVPRKNGKVETAKFYDGMFKVTQSGATTDLTLNEALASCKGKAGSAARKPKKRKLWGDGSGSFRTRGQYSAATVRGTKWLVEDSCAGTLTRVAQGVVSVRDNVKRKTITLRKGRSYTARPKK